MRAEVRKEIFSFDTNVFCQKGAPIRTKLLKMVSSGQTPKKPVERAHDQVKAG